MKVITRQSPSSDFIEMCNQLAPCQRAGDWMNGHSETFGEMLDEYLSDEKANADWAIWVLQALYRHVDEECRLGFIEKIKEPMAAMMLYAKSPNLTEKEIAAFKKNFVGKLPIAEKQLAEGKVAGAIRA